MADVESTLTTLRHSTSQVQIQILDTGPGSSPRDRLVATAQRSSVVRLYEPAATSFTGDGRVNAPSSWTIALPRFRDPVLRRCRSSTSYAAELG